MSVFKKSKPERSLSESSASVPATLRTRGNRPKKIPVISMFLEKGRNDATQEGLQTLAKANTMLNAIKSKLDPYALKDLEDKLQACVCF
jgi:hypothetical protein